MYTTTYDEKLDAIQEEFGLSDEEMSALIQNDDPGIDEFLRDSNGYDDMPTDEELDQLMTEHIPCFEHEEVEVPF